MTDTPVIQLDHVCKTYQPVDGPPVDVLRDVNLTVTAGQSLAIVGPSGSGKSTLLHIIGALDAPTAGRVRLAGEDLAQLDERALTRWRSRRVGFVFQSHHLLPQCTVLENVLVPTLPTHGAAEASQRAQDLLHRVGLGDRMSHRPGELSGGECQRVAVARALINQPQLLLADEPTGSLDSATSQTLFTLLREIARESKLTMVIVTHADGLADALDDKLVLTDGTLSPETDQP